MDNKDKSTEVKLKKIESRQKKIEELLARLFLLQMRQLGWFQGKEGEVASLARETGILESYDRWLKGGMGFLQDHGLLSCREGHYRLSDSFPYDEETLWEDWKNHREVWDKEDGLAAQLSLVETTLKALPSILTGKEPATNVMFPNSSMELVEGIYKNNTLSDYYNRVLADTVVGYLKSRTAKDPGARIRILEIGAGTGGTSAMVFRKLKDYRDSVAEYCYTDLSRAFLAHCEKEYLPDNPYITTRIFDASQPLEVQGWKAGGFDVVIAANVLHATPNIRATLKNAKAALRANGLILLNELSCATVYAHLTFGLLEGWWLYEDEALRISGSPGLFPGSWEKVLKMEGFGSIFFPAEAYHHLGQQIIAALSDGVIRRKVSLPRESPVEQSSSAAPRPRVRMRKKVIKRKKVSAGKDVSDQMVEDHVRQAVRESVARELKIGQDRVQDERSLSEYGVDSIIAVKLINTINSELAVTLKTTDLFDYNNVNALTGFVIKENSELLKSRLSSGVPGEEEEEVVIYEEVADEPEESPRAPQVLSPSAPSRQVPQNISLEGREQYECVLIERPEDIDDLKLSRDLILPLADNEVRIAVRAFSLNFGDLLCVRGLYPTMPPYPYTPGFEVSGIVTETGRGVTNVKPGDPVVGVTGKNLGGHATMTVCEAHQVFRKPHNLSFEEACSLPAVAITMIAVFRKAALKEGEKVLIQTATGGTGLIALQLARYYGAEVYATAGSEGKLDYLRARGVTHCINYQEKDFEEEIKKLTDGEGVDVVINTLAGDAIQKGINCLAPGGRYIEIAMTAIKSARSLDMSVFNNNQTFHSVDMRKLSYTSPGEMAEYHKEMLRLIEEGVLRPTIHKVFSWPRVKEAYHALGNRSNIGKVVVSIPGEYFFSQSGVSGVSLSGKSGFSGEGKNEPVAVVGMSGRFAHSPDLETLWENLARGQNLVDPISRWNLSSFYPPEKKYCNYGSFLEEIDTFDPLFFNISGVEATYMDPQQRIFLEESWKALEDAGYTGKAVEGRSCGVYVGCGNGDYHDLFGTNSPPQALWGNSASILPARISYFLNLQGPALAIDTACSSSLVAIHLACQGLWNREVEMALAGGVFVRSTPHSYISMEKAQMLSVTGACHTFDEKADGFVPGEGAGALVLKRLDDALAAGDHIYGVIRGSGINQDGATNGITAPSAGSQERLERRVYDTFAVDPGKIQMVEAHGTGTRLGDPIEYNALTRAFRHYTDKEGYCSIGSIKTNIGHTATAAGVAGVLKILLSLKHRQMAPSLHFDEGNSNITFEGSPFYVNTSLKDWAVEPGEKRCAVVSSFGFSGTNAHLVIEEAPETEPREEDKPGYIIALSARTSEQLEQQVKQLGAYLRKFPGTSCASLSYTLLAGRKHFSHRLVCVVRNQEELESYLAKWLEQKSLPQVRVMEVKTQEFREQPSLKRYGNECIEKSGKIAEAARYLENLAAIGDLHAQGYDLDVAGLFSPGCRRLPLPVYPFGKDRFWVEEERKSPRGNAPAPHSLLHENRSDFQAQRFISHFRGTEFFLEDHKVNGKMVLPGVVYLEMARGAVLTAWGLPSDAPEKVCLSEIHWLRPLEGGNLEVHTELQGDEEGEVECRILEAGGGVCFRGKTALIECVDEKLDLESLRRRNWARVLSGEECYALFTLMGIDYGPGHRALSRVYAGDNQVLGELALPASLAREEESFVLHPALLDACLQTSVALKPRGESGGMMPFALDEAIVHGGWEQRMWVYLTFNEKEQCFNLDLCDEQGGVRVSLKGLRVRAVKGKTSFPAVSMARKSELPAGSHILAPVWEAGNIAPVSGRDNADLLVVLGEDGLKAHFPGASFINLEKGETISSLEKKINDAGEFGRLLWITPGKASHSLADPELLEKQEDGVILLFRFIKALLNRGWGSRSFRLDCLIRGTAAILPGEKWDPLHGGIIGLAGSLGKEYPHWQVRVVDLPWGEDGVLSSIPALPSDRGREFLAYRDGEWYEQLLLPVRTWDRVDTMYRKEGVYVVIGGAGGVGTVWSEYLIRNYGARIVWLGRRERDRDIEARIDRLAALGPAPEYYSVDARDPGALEKVYRKIKKLHSRIDGVVHSAIVLQDQSLALMEEERFRGSLSAKADISVALTRVFQKEEMDFVLFFSSFQSFLKAPGQSNYAAGCTFKDIFARGLEDELDCLVKTVNWGYWGSVGIVSSEEYKQRMISAGIASIEPEEGMEMVEKLLVSTFPQLVMLKTGKVLEVEGLAGSDVLELCPENNRRVVDSLMTPGALQPLEALRAPELNRREKMEILMRRILGCELFQGGLLSGGRAAQKYNRWMKQAIRFLEKAENYRSSGDREEAWALWNQLVSSSPEENKAQLALVEETMKNLGPIIKGEIPATDIIFPGSSMTLVEGIYKNNAIADGFNQVLAETAARYFELRIKDDPGARIRVLEIGAGTGGTTVTLLRRLKEYSNNIEEYCYTDISRAFLMHGEKEYTPGNPFLTFKIFDVENFPEDQERGSFDLVVGANVLHATRNIRRTVRNARMLLKGNGVLLLNELSARTLYAHLTFGLLDGWWLYEDEALRIPGSPGLSPLMWEKVLVQEGFSRVVYPASGVHNLGQQIIAAVSNQVLRITAVPEEGRAGEETAAPPETSFETAVKKTVTPVPVKNPAVESVSDGEGLKEKSLQYIRKLVAGVLKIPESRIDPSEPLEKYGIDSILVVELTNSLKTAFPDISSTLFFEHQTIESLVNHFLETRREELMKLTGYSTAPAVETVPAAGESAPLRRKALVKTGKPVRALKRIFPSAPVEEIAMVGLSGRYGGAEDLNQFWDNLKEGKNCVSLIPGERWNWEDYYGGEKGKPGVCYTKWGGFIKDVDKFDPLFFKISPVEAERMDPQERLFLEEAYKAIEDAGYTPRGLSESGKVGVYVGVMNSYYPSGASYWSIANRLSYLFDFHGPSMAVDTACSSSLTAIHLAAEGIRLGQAECAIAGGVNLIITPGHYLKLSAVSMLSSGDKCKAFGEKADGFVAGEGVGAVLLKPLSKAIEAGDHIYGVLKESSLNAGGKTNGYTVPNPVSQGELIMDTFKKSRLNPREVTYVEAHGTGTSLGDPIEITGLTRAFSHFTGDKGFCAIGSVKSNIGHCESAAGIAGVTKVLLQMKHGQIVPSIHAETVNPHIDFTKTPFVLNRELKEWKSDRPRLATISSFGAGGANAHMVIEEYRPPRDNVSPGDEEVIILLSARDEERLNARIRQLLEEIETGRLTREDLPHLAYTLQVGREEMDARLGFTAGSLEVMKEKLEACLRREEGPVYFNVVKRDDPSLGFFTADEEMTEALEKWVGKRKYSKLIELWVKGLEFDWNRLYGERKFRRISLPPYPFARKRCWMEAPAASAGRGKPIHPLVHENRSDFLEQRFTTLFKGNEFFLTDHRVNGTRVLPGVAYLEMARAAVYYASRLEKEENYGIRFKEVMWRQPVTLDSEPEEVEILLEPGDGGEVAFRVRGNGDQPPVHSTGKAELFLLEDALVLDLEELKNRGWTREIDAGACYDLFRELGLEYGPAHRGITRLYAGGEEVLGRLKLPGNVNPEGYLLHPAMVDSALQAAIGLVEKPGTGEALVPFAVDEVEVRGPSTTSMWVHLKSGVSGQGRKIDLYLCDDQGRVTLNMKGLRVRSFAGGASSSGEVIRSTEERYLTPVWDPCEVTLSAPAPRENVVILGGSAILKEKLLTLYPGAHLLEGDSGSFQDDLKAMGTIGHLIWSPSLLIPENPGDGLIIEGQEEGVISLFRLIKALLGLGYGGQNLNLSLITIASVQVLKGESFNPLHASVEGLAGSLGKEYPNWSIRYVDLPSGEEVPPEDFFSLPPDPEGDLLAYRNHSWYSRSLVSLQYPETGERGYRENGVYLVVGGAGGIGEAWSEYMIRQYKARIIWLGRREPDEGIKKKIKRLGTLGHAPVYWSVDVGSKIQLEKVYTEIKQTFSAINGIIHSALVLEDQGLINMEEETFRRSLKAKIDVSVNLAAVFHRENLDFMLFFSSMQSFMKAPGQSNYAAGCTFKDAFARYLAGYWNCRVKVMNWGYWGNLGIVASPEYKQRMERMGIASIEPPEAMEALEKLLTGPVDQICLLKIITQNSVGRN